MELLAFVVAVGGSIGLGLVVTQGMLTVLISAMARSTVAFDVGVDPPIQGSL